MARPRSSFPERAATLLLAVIVGLLLREDLVHAAFVKPLGATQPRGNFRLQATPKPVSGTKLITEVGASPLYRADGKEVQFKDLYLPPKGSEGKEGANILIFLRHFG
ncbi:Hypothetical protein NocV09_10600070 [Nannochloropsis oceanica]